MKLYDAPLSGNCYKIRLLLSLLGVSYEQVTLDPFRDTATAEFRTLNPRGQVPVLEAEGALIWDSQAILVYLARRYGGEQWLPTEPLALARVMQWLAVSENEILYGLARARAVKRFGRPWDLAECQAMGRQALDLIEMHLLRQPWLSAERPTIADIACYPYVGLAPEGDIDLAPYPTVRRWLACIQELPGYIGMEGLFTGTSTSRS